MIKTESIKKLAADTLAVVENQMKKSMPANDKAELDNVVNFLCGVIESKEDAKYGYAEEETIRGFLSKVYYTHPQMKMTGEGMFRDMFQLLANAAQYYKI